MRAEQIQADVAVVRVGRNDQATDLERSDETAAVTFVDRGELGGVVRTPGATIETGTPTGTGPDKPGQPVRTGAPTPGPERGRKGSGEASAVVQFAQGNGYGFKSREEAEAFLDKHSSAEGLWGEARENAGKASRALCLWQCDDPVGLRPDPPPPPIVFREGGAKADFGGEYERGSARAEGALGAAGALGVREDNRNGERTYYHRISGNGSGSVGALFASAGGAGKLEGIAEIKVDRKGKPLDLTVKSSRAYSGRLQFAPELEIDAATKATLTDSDSGGLGRQFDYEASLRLDDPENARLAEDFLRSYALDPTGQILPEAEELRDRIDARGTITLSTCGTYESGKEYGASASLVAKLGGKLVLTDSGSRLIEAHTRQPGGSFVQRADCVPP